MENIIKILQDQIASCKEMGEDFDDKSWSYEQGVLITANEAQKIVDIIIAPQPKNKPDGDNNGG